MNPRLWSFALASSLLAACGDVVVPGDGSTSAHGSTGSTTSSSTTSAATGASSSTTSAGTGAGGQGGGGADAGTPGCPAELAPPADCGAFADACAGAQPIAAGGDTTYARGVAVDATYVYWAATPTDLGPCSGVIYRTPKAGGPAARFAETSTSTAFDVDDAALYVAEGFNFRAFDTAQGAATDLGSVEPDNTAAYQAYGVTRTPGGMVGYGVNAPWLPSFFHLGPAGLTAIATHVGSNGSLGSVPSFDGASLFFSWSPSPWDGKSPLVRVDAGSTATTALGADAATRMWPSVIASDADVFFITGDPEVDFGMVGHPMGISRVAKAGGAPAVLVPPGPVMIDQLLVDATDLYFSTSPLLGGPGPYAIQSVPRAGGAVHTVWSGPRHPDSLRQDAGALYFALAVSKITGEITGPGGLVVRVAKTATMP